MPLILWRVVAFGGCSRSVLVQFTSDRSVSADGFAAIFTCGAPSPPPTSAIACWGVDGATLYDGGPIAHYNGHGHGEDCQWTAVCPVGSSPWITLWVDSSMLFCYLGRCFVPYLH